MPSLTAGSSSNTSIPECFNTYTDDSSHHNENSANPSIPECLNAHTDGSIKFRIQFGNNSITRCQTTHEDCSEITTSEIKQFGTRTCLKTRQELNLHKEYVQTCQANKSCPIKQCQRDTERQCEQHL